MIFIFAGYAADFHSEVGRGIPGEIHLILRFIPFFNFFLLPVLHPQHISLKKQQLVHISHRRER